MSVRNLIDKSKNIDGFERLQHPSWVDVTKKRQHSIEFSMTKIHETYKFKHKSGQNFKKKEYLQKVERRLLVPDLAGYHMSGHHTWLHSDTEFPSGWRALAFSKNFVNFVLIGSWPFSKFRQNPSGLLPSLPYH